MTIGESIRHYRKIRELTQAQLAKEVGVSSQAISKWETDAGFPDTTQIVPLARALHITTDTLLHFTDRRKTSKNFGMTPSSTPTPTLTKCEKSPGLRWKCTRRTKFSCCEPL